MPLEMSIRYCSARERRDGVDVTISFRRMSTGEHPSSSLLLLLLNLVLVVVARICSPPSLIPPLTFVHHASTDEFTYACPSGFVLSGYPHRLCNRTSGEWEPNDAYVGCCKLAFFLIYSIYH